MPNIPKSMRAAAIDRFGGPRVLKLRRLPVEVPGPGDVLIALHTAGVGTWDLSLRDGSDSDGGQLSIFGKTDPSAASPREAGPANGSASPTVLGPGARFVGEVSGDEDIVINGRFEGTARVDGKLTVGPSGDVLGDLAARTVVVEGRVSGQILAEERAELLSTAVVQGIVQAPRVVISEGAQLEGKVTMSAPAPVEQAPE